MKYFLFFFVFFSIVKEAYPQSPATLNIDDIFPEVQARVWYKGKDEIRKIPLKGKPLLLDFGTTTCPPCIKSFHKLNKILPEMGDSLEVYFVTRQPLDIVQKFFGRKDLFDHIEVPIIYSDTVLHNLFEHVVQPHVIWIDRDARVANITKALYVDDVHIRKFSAGKKLSLDRKNDFPYDYRNPLSVVNDAQLKQRPVPKVVRSMTVTEGIEGVLPRVNFYPMGEAGSERFCAINMDVVTLYNKLYNLLDGRSPFVRSHILVEDTTGDVIPWDSVTSWLWQKKFCFEVYAEFQKLRDTAYLMDTFSDALGIKVQVKNIPRTCWMIKDLQYPGHFPAPVEGDHDFSLSGLIHYFNLNYGNVPLINQSSLTGNKAYWQILEFDESRFLDFHSLKKYLNEKGLTLVEENVEVECLVIQIL